MTQKGQSFNFIELLNKQRSRGINPPLCFFTDIDFTLIYQNTIGSSQVDSSQPVIEQNQRYRVATFQFFDLLTRYDIPIIPVSGIDLPILLAHQKNSILPNNIEIAILSVGTEIWLRQSDGSYVLDEVFKKYVEEDIGFKRQNIYPICERFRDIIHLEHYPDIELEFQPRDRKTPIVGQDACVHSDGHYPQNYKISFNFVGTTSIALVLEKMFRQLLSQKGYPNIRVLFSHDKYLEGGRIRFNIDVLPVTKDESIRYMTSVYGCVAIYAGDSGNDVMAIKNAADAAIIVGNARNDLLDEVANWNVLSGRTLKKFEVNKRTIRIYRDEDNTSRGPESLIKASQELLKLFARYQKIKNHKYHQI
jgi:hypothetical protein